MRAPRLELIFALCISLTFAFVCMYFVMYIMIIFLSGRGLDAFEFKDTGGIIMYFVSMFGASAVLCCGTYVAVKEQSADEPPAIEDSAPSEEESQ